MDGTFPPHVSFADSRGLAWVDPMAFATLAEHFDATRARAKVQITKQAMVHPPGLVGTITAGYFLTYVTGFPFRAFSVPGPALAWLQISEELFASWEAHIASARPLPELVVDLRQWLQRSLSDPDIDQAASTLRLSKRTLQRRLEAHHTSYQRELDHVRFYVARRELSDTDDKVGAIAAECGFKTQQHFQDWFRQIAGCTPGEYRAKTRGSP